MGDSQSFVTVKKRAAQITQWWDLSAKFMEQCSTPLAESVLKILKATALENPSSGVVFELFADAAAVHIDSFYRTFCSSAREDSALSFFIAWWLIT